MLRNMVHRFWGVLLVFTVALLSFLMNLYKYLNVILVKLGLKHCQIVTNSHEERVAYVRKQVKNWIKHGKYVKMCTARPGWHNTSMLLPNYKHKMHQIEVNLSNIIYIDEKSRVVCVEPLCNMGELSSHLIPRGWGLAVTPEFEELTVGGMINGFGIETSSHLHGLFQHIVMKMEVVLADGSVVTCSRHENADLFFSIPVSYGTLGFLVSAELKIIPVKQYVKLQYLPFKDTNNNLLFQTFESASRDKSNDFVECLMFSSDSSVLMIGRMTDEVEADKVNRIGDYYKPWFFTIVQAYLKKQSNNNNELWHEYIPLKHYYHRHSKCYFWELKNVLAFANHLVFRYLLGWTMPLPISLLKLVYPNKLRERSNNNHLRQDFLLPISTLEESLGFFHKEARVYPIWLCPFTLPYQPGFLHPESPSSDTLYVDVGLYGKPHLVDGHSYQPETTTRKMERFVKDKRGYQMLYAECYQSRDELREMFDHSLYDKVRKKLVGCEQAFPEMYDKVNRSVRC